MWTLLLALALAADPPPESSETAEAELIPGVQNAGLPPQAPNALKPAANVPTQQAGTEVKQGGGLPPEMKGQEVKAPPALKSHQGLPPPPPPIQAAGLPPMAEDVPMAEAPPVPPLDGEWRPPKKPPGPKVILWEDLPVAEDPEKVEAEAIEVRKVE